MESFLPLLLALFISHHAFAFASRPAGHTSSSDPSSRTAPAPIPFPTQPGPRAPMVPVSAVPLFQSDDILNGIQVEAPFTDLYTQSTTAFSAYVSSGEVAGTVKSPKVIGKVTLPDGTVFENVSVSVRGNSSRLDSQCTFAKLELKFSTPTTGTVLSGLKTVKIATHCGESEYPTETWGRVANQKEPFREAFLYTVFKKVGVVSLLSRPAIVTYHDTSAVVDASRFPSNPLTRNAFFLEDETAAAHRYGDNMLQKPSSTAKAKAFLDVTTSQVDPLEVATAIYAETLAENFDWYVKMSPTDLGNGALSGLADNANWNVNIISNSQNQALIQVYDWDISGWVRGPWGQDTTSYANGRISSDARITPDVVAAAKKKFLDAKNDVYWALQTSFANSADGEGVENMRNHLDTFYSWISSTE